MNKRLISATVCTSFTQPELTGSSSPTMRETISNSITHGTWTAAWGVAEQHRGVIVIPQDAGWGLHQMAEEVELVLDRTAAVENRLFRCTAEQGWIEE